MSPEAIAPDERATAPAKPTAPDDLTVADFAYPDFYLAMSEREQLQVSREEVTWSEVAEPLDRPVDVLLNFGCAVRQTPHLQRETVAVLEALGVDFAAVAGQKFCCGRSYTANSFDDVARRVATGSVRRMAAYRPKRAIQWCSGCQIQFHDLVGPDIGIEFSSEGLAAFLLERIDELGDAVPWRAGVRLTALVHGHLGEHIVRDGHPPIAIQLLERIPGVQVLGVADSVTLDLCDNGGSAFGRLTSDEYRETQSKIETDVAGLGADTVVTMYHGCTRDLSKFSSDRIRVRHYISILAEALGVPMPDRFSQYWQLGDPEKVAEASRANWESWGIEYEEALRLAHKYFVPSYKNDVPDCPCQGSCTRTGADWVDPIRIKR